MLWKISFFASFVWNWRRYFNLKLLSSQLNLSKNKSYSALESCYAICCCYRELLIQLQLDLHWKLELVNEWVANSPPSFFANLECISHIRQNHGKILSISTKISLKCWSAKVPGIRHHFLRNKTQKNWVQDRSKMLLRLLTLKNSLSF